MCVCVRETEKERYRERLRGGESNRHRESWKEGERERGRLTGNC